MKTTNKEKSEHNKLEVLKAIANNGWMTTALCGAWQWSKSSKKVADHKALGILKKLQKDGLVFEKKTPDQITAWVLTHSGAEVVNAHFEENGIREWAHHGYDIVPSYLVRHAKVVEYLIRAGEKGLAIIGNAQIRSLRNKQRKDKVDKDKMFPMFDAVTVNLESNYTVGVLIVGNCGESTQERLTKYRKHVDEIHLIGDPRTIRGLQRKLGQEILKAQ